MGKECSRLYFKDIVIYGFSPWKPTLQHTDTSSVGCRLVPLSQPFPHSITSTTDRGGHQPTHVSETLHYNFIAQEYQPERFMLVYNNASFQNRLVRVIYLKLAWIMETSILMNIVSSINGMGDNDTFCFKV